MQKRNSRKRRHNTSSSSDFEEIQRKRKKKRLGPKRKIKSPSSPAIVSEASAADKRLEVIQKLRKCQ